MQYTLALLGLVAAVSAVPQGVTSAIAPASSPPPGCQASYAGTFEIETVNVTTSAKRGLEKRQADVLMLTLNNGILLDAKGRTGYIAANQQFQFDAPAQTGAIYTAGWSVCANNSLSIGGSSIFYQCLSGDFYNLYADTQGAQCSQIYIEVIPGMGAAPATQLSDGQPQATPAPLCQIADGQPQVTSCAAPVTQISDGQIQATTPRAPVTQISDGQIQATTPRAPVTQISDGQIQAPTSVSPVTQISDGQIQAPQPTNPVGQISDGQIQATPAPSAASTRPPAATYTGAAIALRGEFFGVAAGVLAVALL